MPAVGFTDNGNMFGAVEFYFGCQAKEIKPIIGLEVYLAPKGRFVKGEDPEAVRLPNTRLVLLAKNYKGYQTLCQISSKGYQEGFYYKPRVDFEVLKEFNSNVIALTGGLRGVVPFAYQEKGEDEALKKIRELKEIYGEDLFLEVQKTNVPVWDELNEFLKSASQTESIPVVAANEVYFAKREDKLAQEVMMCIGMNKTLQDESRFRLGSSEYYFKTPEEMKRAFGEWQEPLDNTLEVARRCDIHFKLKDSEGRPIYHLPTYPTQEGRTVEQELESVARSGLEERFKEAEVSGEPIQEKETYQKRLDYELGIISDMGFIGYFLIVQNFIHWAKENEIPVGPGRGSGAGSLVAYSLKITDLDPLKYNLIFERFLNPERISMPDFDIDFCQDRRGEVIDYVTEKYGAPSVSQIITFGKLQAKAAIRDVGRVLGMTFAEVDVVAKLIPDELGITLKSALEKEPRLTELMEDDPKISQLMELAQNVEGLNRHASIHAAGVIISDRPLVEHAPLYKGNEGENVVQYDMKYSESIGLIKFDFLGLKTLTHINNAFKLIKKNRGKTVTPLSISMNDEGIYELMSSGDTPGVFQFEGGGITDLIRNVKPTCFEDITAINALYRPGPMQMLDEYTSRKHGKSKVKYLFPELEEILQETYGIIVYQEQVQLIAAKIANYSLGEADILRRAMGKKKPEEMAKQKVRFLKGAEENGFDRKKSEELFELMAKFAEYGFNKSHAAAYCVLAAQTAWLKNYYPVEFFAALLGTEMGNTDKVVQYTKDARAHGIEVSPPSVNASEYKFTVESDTIYFGMGAIKGVGQGAVDAIVGEREARGPFESVESFFERMDTKALNKKVLECLIQAGAFDEFDWNRAELFAGYEMLLERASKDREDKAIGQASLFDLSEDTKQEIVKPSVPPWSKREVLAREKQVLGFFLTDHPLNGIDNLLSRYISTSIENLSELENKASVAIGGIITSKRERLTRKATLMAFFGIEDLSGEVEVIAFPDAYEKIRTQVIEDEICILTGLVERDGESFKVIAEEVISLEEKMKRSKRLLMRLNADNSSRLDELKSLCEKFPGGANLTIEVNFPDEERTVELDVHEPEGINPTREFFDCLQEKFGSTHFVDIRG